MTKIATPPTDADGVYPAPNEVRFERLLPGPIERLWAYLTESDKRATWLASGPMDLRVGGDVELNFHNLDLSPHKAPAPETYKHCENSGTNHGKVTRCEPPRLLSYTWGPGEHASEVTFELSPRGDDVLLILTHRRTRDRKDTLSISGGWHAHLGILSDVLNGRVPQPFWPAYAQLEARYAERLQIEQTM